MLMLYLERTTSQCAGCGGESDGPQSDFCGGCRERGLAFCELCGRADTLAPLTIEGRPAQACQDCHELNTCENCGAKDDTVLEVEDQQDGGRVRERRCATCRGELAAA